MLSITMREFLVVRNAFAILVFMFLINKVFAQEQYNASFIRGNDAAQLVDILASGDDILPGTYLFDIYLNGLRIGQRDLKFERRSKGAKVTPCITMNDYREFGLQLPAEQNFFGCYDLLTLSGDVRLFIDAGIHRIDLDVPQIHLISRPKGSVSTSIYDQGITAGYINYSFNSYRSSYSNRSASSDADYYFASVKSGFNTGAWRLRNDSTAEKQTGDIAHFRNIGTWAETDIADWRSRLLIGQSSTGNSIFNGFSFSGVQLSSSSNMLPDSLLGYAPIIRGVAASNARVEIRQNGYTVYTAQVPAGPFALNDVYPSTSSGDLQVSLIEADGSKTHFTVPFSAVPNMLRDGIVDYQLIAGRYRDGRSLYQPKFIQAGVSRGLAEDITPYGGLLVAENYHSGVFGIGKNLGVLGALSLDLAYSETDLAVGDKKSGQSMRFLYSKSLNSIGTEFRLAGYRYSTSGYYDFTDAVAERDSWDNDRYRLEYLDNSGDYQGVPEWTEARRRIYYSDTFNNKRQRLDMSVNQRVSKSSRLYLNISDQSYWGATGRDRTLQIGYNGAFNRVTYGVFVQDTRSNVGYSDRSVNLTVSLPVGTASQYINSNSSISHSQRSGSTYSTGINGTLLDDSRLNYGVQASQSEQTGAYSSLNLGYQGNKGNVDFSQTYSKQYQQTSLGASGGLVVHEGGLTLTQPLNDTLVLVEAKDAKGVRLDNQAGTSIDDAGFAVMTSAMPYRQNRVALRTEDIRSGLEIPMPAREIVPTQGAIVRVKFETYLGRNLLILSKRPDGSVPTIGANVFGRDGRLTGVVGTQGEIFVSGVNDGDLMLVKWGDEAQESCSILIPFHRRDSIQPSQGYETVSLMCDMAP